MALLSRQPRRGCDRYLCKDMGMKENALTLGLCGIGVVGVAYGMIRENHVVFIIGLLFVIAGYWRIRKKLKIGRAHV